MNRGFNLRPTCTYIVEFETYILLALNPSLCRSSAFHTARLITHRTRRKEGRSWKFLHRRVFCATRLGSHVHSESDAVSRDDLVQRCIASRIQAPTPCLRCEKQNMESSTSVKIACAVLASIEHSDKDFSGRGSCLFSCWISSNMQCYLAAARGGEAINRKMEQHERIH